MVDIPIQIKKRSVSIVMVPVTCFILAADSSFTVSFFTCVTTRIMKHIRDMMQGMVWDTRNMNILKRSKFIALLLLPFITL